MAISENEKDSEKLIKTLENCASVVKDLRMKYPAL